MREICEQGMRFDHIICAEGISLDPVYTGKAFAGLIAMAKEGAFAPDM